MSTERELIKGSTQTLVLAILRDGPRHGYAIAREIEHRSTNGMKFKDGTLYPALQTLEREGCIVGAWEVVEGGPSRKVYTLTPHGQEELARRTGEWNEFTAMINRILNNGPPDTNELKGIAAMLRHLKSEPLSILPRSVTPIELPASSLPEEAVHRREDYLDQIFAPLTGTLPFLRRQEMRREIQNHLDSLISAHMEMGDAPVTASQKAFDQFGKPKDVAASIKRSSGNSSWKRVYNWWTLPRLSMAALLPVLMIASLTYVGGMSRQSHQTPPSAPTVVASKQFAVVPVGFSHSAAVLNHPCSDCHHMTETFIKQGTATIPIRAGMRQIQLNVQMDENSKPRWVKPVR